MVKPVTLIPPVMMQIPSEGGIIEYIKKHGNSAFEKA